MIPFQCQWIRTLSRIQFFIWKMSQNVFKESIRLVKSKTSNFYQWITVSSRKQLQYVIKLLSYSLEKGWGSKGTLDPPFFKRGVFDPFPHCIRACILAFISSSTHEPHYLPFRTTTFDSSEQNYFFKWYI